MQILAPSKFSNVDSSLHCPEEDVAKISEWHQIETHNAQILQTLLRAIKKFAEASQRRNATVAFKFSNMNISSLAKWLNVITYKHTK